MRYCETCGSIFELDGNYCAACQEKTVDIGLEDNQTELFPETEVDKINNLYRYFKNELSEKQDDVNKAEKKLREKKAERDVAATNLINYDKVVKAKQWDGDAQQIIEIIGLPAEGETYDPDDIVDVEPEERVNEAARELYQEAAGKYVDPDTGEVLDEFTQDIDIDDGEVIE